MSGRKGKGGKSPVPHDGLFKTFLTHTGVSLDIENYCTVSLFFEQAYL